MDINTSSPQRSFAMLVALVAIGGAFYLAGQRIASQPARVQQEAAANRELTVQGHGEVVAKPDIARITLGIDTGPQASAKTALDIVGKKFQQIVSTLSSSGIKQDDIKTTNLSIYPNYNFQNGKQNIQGYTASESVEVKIRNLDSIGDVLAKTTIDGVNQAGGVSFDIDDPSAIQEQAREAAIADAKKNAEKLAQALGVNLGNVKTFTTTSTPGPIAFDRTAAVGLGAGAPEGSAPVAPPVPAGSQQVTADVNVTYSLK